MKPLNSLQAGRGLAATSVAAFHLSLNMGLERYGGQPVFTEYTRYGDRGVDFFFVLSGFIILMAHYRHIGVSSAIGPYFHRRFARVFPVYWLYTLGFAVALAIFGGTDAKVPATVGDWLTSLSLLRFSAATPPLPVAWTLFHEVAFYAVFSLLLLRASVGWLALAAFGLLAVFNYGYPAEFGRDAWSVYTSGYNLFFLLGMAAFMAHRRGYGGGGSLVAGALVVFASIAAHPVIGELSPLLVAIGFALILLGATALERRGTLQVPRFLVILGDASYSIYLTHLPLEGLLLKVAIRLHLHATIGFGLTYLVVLAGAVGLGCVAYYVVERPLLQLFRSRGSASSTQTPAREVTPV